ncbi:MAG: AAC(3)-I family aminoglycoside N-acetyltransferase [Coriobacteriia bacterium]
MATTVSFEILRLRADDIDRMRELLDMFGEVFEEKEMYSAAQPSDGYLRQLLSEEGFVALAAISDGRIVGGLAAYELRKYERERSEFYIYDLAVLADYRRLGIATALITELKRIAKARGAWVVFLDADLGDDPAIALYDKLGSREEVLHFDIPVD